MDENLEEGEISGSDSTEEDGINPYIPLERPVIHFEPVVSTKEDALSMEQEATGSEITPTPLLNSDSDSDEELHAKKLILSSPKKSKYTVWNKDPNGDLTDFLNQFGMDEMPDPENSRNVENYPLPFPRNSKPSLRARRRKIPHKGSELDGVKQNFKKISRYLDSLEVNETNTIEEVAEDITKKLTEHNQELILRIVLVLGKDKAIELYEKTRVIEKMGGMLVPNGSRKRTSGGVFIYQVRSDKDIADDKLRAIFEYDALQQKKLRNAMSKIRRKRKRELTKKSNAAASSELSNPPPSPDVPDETLVVDFIF